MRLVCKWCGKTIELAGDSSSTLTTCTNCLEDIIRAIPEETRNNPHVTIIGLSGNKKLPEC